jgi:DNA polymerase III delta prime subunit
MKSILHHPAHLWISDPQTLEQEVVTTLQGMLCDKQGCLRCSTCTTISEKTHPWVKWIEPENNYTTDLVNTVIKNSSLQLDATEYRFFILTKSERLTPHCANRLLKTIEEPHPNYFFIFFSQNKDVILPTIQSRCLLNVFENKKQLHPQQAVIAPFINLMFDSPGAYFQLLTTSQIREQESYELLNVLFEYWSQQLKKIVTEHGDTKKAEKIVQIVTRHLEQPIMPGSSKILWKNVYLSLHHTACSTK